MAECYKQLKNYERALYNYKKQMAIAWYNKDIVRELETYDNIGICYYYLGNINKAIFYHNRFINKQVEEDMSKIKWNDYVLKKKGKSHTHSLFEDYNIKLNDKSFIFPHQSKQYTNHYSIKETIPVDLMKITSPKYENNDLKKQMLLKALKHSFIKGDITHEDYNTIQKDNTRLNSFTPFRRKAHLIKDQNSTYNDIKLQKYANNLMKKKIRTLNIRNASSTYRNTPLSKESKSFSSRRHNTIIKEGSSGSLFVIFGRYVEYLFASMF